MVYPDASIHTEEKWFYGLNKATKMLAGNENGFKKKTLVDFPDLAELKKKFRKRKLSLR